MQYGLTNEQVLENRKRYGTNKLPEPEMKKWYHFAKEALSETITMLLIGIAAVQIMLALLGVMEILDPLMILLVLLIVTTIAVKTGLGVQKSAAELRAKTALRYCDVIREGKIITINKDDLVVGDLAIVSLGHEIFADGYLVEGKISVNNAAINGETKECKKTPVPGYVHERTTSTDAYTNQNCLFAGTTVMSGEGVMLVTDVGVKTVNGDTLIKMQTLEAPKTALNIAIDKLCDFISFWGTIAAAITFTVLTVSGIMEVGFSEYFRGDILDTVQKIAQNVSVALTIIVAAVPEGLPMIIKIVTKQNVSVMENFNILAKNTNKIPELAYVDLICTDKTGTLTTGIMTPSCILNGKGDELTSGGPLWNRIAENLVLNNSASYNSEQQITGGNSIDRAALSLIDQTDWVAIRKSNPMKDKQIFNSTFKYSAYESQTGVSYYKGAPERIIDHCSVQMLPDGNIGSFKRDHIKEKISELTQKSMRCIALACKTSPLTENEIPDDMIFLGILGVMDPVREEVPYAVEIAKKAGIQVIEITGDCIETAVAVAKDCGIYQDGDIALTNDQFEGLSDEQVKEIIPSLRVISRCSPNTKLRLVTLAQEMGRSVAMTGDGVNDSPALKRADVGFGMNSGSDVAKEASDIVLTDDNFASIVKAVELGRTFMHNIMMFLEFQLPINITLLILSMIFPVLATGTLLASVQILIINIIMDSLNSLAFGGEPPKEEYMKEYPIKKGSGLFIRGAKTKIGISTLSFIFIYMLLILSPVSNLFHSDAEAMTARFALLCFMAVFNGFNIRTDHLNLFTGIKKNRLFIEIAAGILCGTVVICSIAGETLKVAAISVNGWVAILALSLMVIPIDWMRKTLLLRENKIPY